MGLRHKMLAGFAAPFAGRIARPWRLSLFVHLLVLGTIAAIDSARPPGVPLLPAAVGLHLAIDEPVELQSVFEPIEVVQTMKLPEVDIALEDVLRQVERMPDDERLVRLEDNLKAAEQIPLERAERITSHLREEFDLPERRFDPVEQVEFARLDLESIVVFYRIIAKDGRDIFQELWIDKQGNFVIGNEKPASQMNLAEKTALEAFQMTGKTPMFRQWRNIAMGIIDRKAKKPPSAAKPGDSQAVGGQAVGVADH